MRMCAWMTSSSSWSRSRQVWMTRMESLGFHQLTLIQITPTYNSYTTAEWLTKRTSHSGSMTRMWLILMSYLEVCLKMQQEETPSSSHLRLNITRGGLPQWMDCIMEMTTFKCPKSTMQSSTRVQVFSTWARQTTRNSSRNCTIAIMAANWTVRIWPTATPKTMSVTTSSTAWSPWLSCLETIITQCHQRPTCSQEMEYKTCFAL